MMSLSDLQRVDIAKNEYKKYKEGEDIYIDKGSTKIGYVSEVVDNK